MDELVGDKKVKIFREDKIDDDTIKKMIMKRAELLGIDLTTDDIDFIMQ